MNKERKMDSSTSVQHPYRFFQAKSHEKKHLTFPASLLIFIVLSISIKVTFSQNLPVDSTFHYYYYDQRYSLFQLLPDTPGEIIMLGNSITNGGEWMEIFNNPNVKNRGISGDNTFGVLHRIGEITSSQPAKVFILIGINDIARDTPPDVILSNYKRIILVIQQQSPATKIFVQSILPTSNKFELFPKAKNKDHIVRQVNQEIEKMATETGVTFIDLYPHFLDEQKQLADRFTHDGLHLSGEGYLLWASIIKPWLQMEND